MIKYKGNQGLYIQTSQPNYGPVVLIIQNYGTYPYP